MMKRLCGSCLFVALGVAAIMLLTGCEDDSSSIDYSTPETYRIAAWATSSKYGAIAYSPDTGASGVSWDYSSRSEAESRALRECDKNDAIIVVWFRNASAALAVSSRGRYAAHWSTSLADAKAKALAASES